MTSSGKNRVMEGQNEQALIRCLWFCAASDQSLDFLLHMSICRKPFSRFLHNLKIIYKYIHMEKADKTISEHKYMEKADLGKHCLLGFPR